MEVNMKLKDDLAVIEFKGVHPTIVNSYRRIILDEVPTFAIEDVEIVKNESPIYDETIAHRLGLIPLKTDLNSYNFKEKCKCGGVGCALCEVKMTIKKEGEGLVLSSEIKSNDPNVMPVYKNMPITKLFDNSKFEVNLTAILGKGREHAKWSPAHSYLREIKEGEIELYIEPFGQLSAKEIFNMTTQIIEEKIVELEGLL